MGAKNTDGAMIPPKALGKYAEIKEAAINEGGYYCITTGPVREYDLFDAIYMLHRKGVFQNIEIHYSDLFAERIQKFIVNLMFTGIFNKLNIILTQKVVPDLIPYQVFIFPVEERVGKGCVSVIDPVDISIYENHG